MRHLHQLRIRNSVLASALVISVSMAIQVPAAHAASNCVVGPGVTQNATTVTGTRGNDTIDCTSASPGKKIIGKAGNDTITGTAYQDTIN